VTLGLICKHYGISWADAKSLRLWEVAALVDHVNDQHKAAEGEQRRAARRAPTVR